MDLAEDIEECPVDSFGSDHELAERLVKADGGAFTRAYRTHSPRIFRFAYHMTGDSAKAAEIAQEVFVWLIHHPGGYDPDRGPLSSFLVGVARQFVRRQRWKEFRWAPFGKRAGNTPALVADPDRALDLETMRKTIAAMPQHYREVLALYDLEGNSYEETAMILKCSVGTVRSRLHRARELLTRKLQRRTGP